MSKLLYTVSLLYTLLLVTGCSSTGMTVGTYLGNQRYMQECMGPNSKHSWRDPVCQHQGEPVPSNGMNQYRVSKPNLSDPRVRVACEMAKDNPRRPEWATESVCGKPVN